MKFRYLLIVLLVLSLTTPGFGESLVDGPHSEGLTKEGFQLIIPDDTDRAHARMMTLGVGPSITDLPIWGGYFQIATDGEGAMWMIYHEGGAYQATPIAIFNLITMERVAVPDAVAYRGFLYSGFAVRFGKIHVQWTIDNMRIAFKTYDIAARSWSGQEIIYQDKDYPTQSLSDTNRSSLAVADDGTIMSVIQADGKLVSRHKRPGQSWSGVQEVFPWDNSEAGWPSVKAIGNKFVCAYTCTCGDPPTASHPTRPKAVGISFWDGDWSKADNRPWPNHTFKMLGAPDVPFCAVDDKHNIYTTWVEWEIETQKYSKSGEGQRVSNSWSEMMWKLNYSGNDAEHPPNTSIAVDYSGNVVACLFNFVSSDTSTFLRIKESGGDWYKVQKGEEGHISIMYNPANKYFYLVYIQGGAVKLETFSFEEQTEPTPTPTPSVGAGELAQWDVLTVVKYTDKNYGNPFTDEILHAWFAEPGTSLPTGECKGKCHKVQGVYDGTENGKHKFIVRFRPDKKGIWTYATFAQSGNSDLRTANKTVNVEDARPNNHGPMRRDGRFIVHADGTGHQHLGGTAFGLVYKGPWKQFLQRYIDKGVTYFRIGFWITWGRGCHGQDNGYGGCCDEAAINGCWLGIWPFEHWAYPRKNNPDWTRMNIQQFRKLDGVMDYLLERGCYAEILLYDSTVNGSLQEYGAPHGYLAGDVRHKNYLEYMAKRYKAYPNFWYELGNEVRHSTPQNWMRPSQEWVLWVFNTVKGIDPGRLLAYEAPGASAYADPQWEFDPSFHYSWRYTPAQGSHRAILESDLCDIINIHTARGGNWWESGPKQMEFLSREFNKPSSNDEPHRKGYYHIPCEDWQIRRSAWLTAMVGNSYYTIHGVSMGDFCRACIEDADLGANMSLHFTKFWDKLGVYNFDRDNSLLESSGKNKRAMHHNGVYVYYCEDGNGWVKFKTHKKQKYEIYVMDTTTGAVIAEKIKDSKDPTVDVGNKRDYAAFVRPYTPPVPTPTPTPTVTPTPTPGNGGGIGCPFHRSAFAGPGVGMGKTSADELFQSIALGMLMLGLPLFVYHRVRKHRKPDEE